jgi:hypothetical protein
LRGDAQRNRCGDGAQSGRNLQRTGHTTANRLFSQLAAASWRAEGAALPHVAQRAIAISVLPITYLCGLPAYSSTYGKVLSTGASHEHHKFEWIGGRSKSGALAVCSRMGAKHSVAPRADDAQRSRAFGYGFRADISARSWFAFHLAHDALKAVLISSRAGIATPRQ